MLARMYHDRNGQPDRKLILSRNDAYHGTPTRRGPRQGWTHFTPRSGLFPGDFGT